MRPQFHCEGDSEQMEATKLDKQEKEFEYQQLPSFADHVIWLKAPDSTLWVLKWTLW